jgi:hypothetical protein
MAYGGADIACAVKLVKPIPEMILGKNKLKLYNGMEPQI